MIKLTFCKTAKEWRDQVLWGGICEATDHDPRCNGIPTEAHHIVYKSHIAERNYWILENGIALSQLCHMKAHATHNGNLDLARCNRAVDALNCVENYKIARFTKNRKVA